MQLLNKGNTFTLSKKNKKQWETEQVKQLSAGYWASIAPEVRPGITKNANGSMKPFYVIRNFKCTVDGKFTLQMVNSADAYQCHLLKALNAP